MRIALTEQAQTLMQERILPGDIVIDATAGNGHDTLLLAKLVGETGQVFAFDNQEDAIESTQARLTQAELQRRVILLCQGHEQMAQHIPKSLNGKIKAVIFNLGYLPGGDKSHTTQTSSTLLALTQAFELLMPGGMLSIMAYPGHPGGRAEAEALKQWATTLVQARCDISIPPSQNNNATEWLVMYKD